MLAYNAGQQGLTLTDENQTSIDDFFTSVQSYADTYGLTIDQALATKYGALATKDSLTSVLQRYLLADQFVTQLEASFTFADADLQQYYTDNADSYTNTDLPIVRHILFMAPVGVEGTTDATDEELANAKALADAALAKVTDYDTMVSVGDAALADGTASESAEYTVTEGEMVTEFNDWCYDAARQVGDKAVIQTEYGYHVMYYVGSEKDWMKDAISSLTTDKYNAYIDEQEALPIFAMTVS